MKDNVFLKIKPIPALSIGYGAYFSIFFISQIIDWHNVKANSFTEISISPIFYYVALIFTIAISLIFGVSLLIKGKQEKHIKTMVAGGFLIASPIIVFILLIIYSIIFIALAYPG